MQLLELLNKQEFGFPIQREPNIQIKLFIEKILDDYSFNVNSTKDLLKGINIKSYQYRTQTAYKNAINFLIDSFKRTISAYFDGKTAAAYYIFYTALHTIGIINFIKSETYKQHSSFYRIRKKESNYPLDIHELFHIPFDKLEKVSTQRFSIPGYPALYIGNSLYLCWEEMNRPDARTIQCALLKNVTDLKILNFDWTEYSEKLLHSSITDHELLDFGILWPLFAVCSIKVPLELSVDPFKGEYIFPQLFLQYIKSVNVIDGIRYPSCKPRYDITNYPKDRFHNIVIPVKTVSNSGYCDYLKSIFVTSDVETWNLQDFANTGDKLTRILGTSYRNKDVTAICLYNNDRFIDYKKTRFWEMEALLDTIPITDLRNL